MKMKYLQMANEQILALLVRLLWAAALVLLTFGAQAQNLFVYDYYTGAIYEYTPGGVRSTFAFGFNGSGGMAFDSAGDLFVSDNYNGIIDKFTPGGVQSTVGYDLQPIGLACNSAGDLFEADFHSGNINEFTPGGAESTFAGGFGQYGPLQLAFDSSGKLFVSSQTNVNGNGVSSITEITPGGVESLFATGLSYYPEGLAINSAGDVFESFGGSTIYEITPGGTRSTFASGLNVPYGLAFDSAGNLFEADRNSGNIYKFTPGGVRSTFASGLIFPTLLAFQPVPKLAIILSGTNVILTWRTNVTAFTLQSTTNLVSPAVWNTNMPSPVVVNGQNAVTNPISGTQMFFRLSQ